MRTIELAPLSPFHDIEGTVRKLKAAKPGITQLGINQAVKRMLDRYDPRHPGRHVALFGADIMTAQLDQIPAWPYLPDGQRRRLLDHPIDGGLILPDTLDGDDDPKRAIVAQKEAANRLDRVNVNRSVLISPRGLSQTYIWCLRTGWLQEVTDADYDLILGHPGNRRLFRDRDMHGPYLDVRSYEAPGIVTAREVTTNQRDANYMMRQMLPKR